MTRLLRKTENNSKPSHEKLSLIERVSREANSHIRFRWRRLDGSIACARPILELYSIYARLMFDSCSIHVRSMFDACSMHVRSMFDPCSILARSMFDLFPTYFRSLLAFKPSSIRVWCAWQFRANFYICWSRQPMLTNYSLGNPPLISS